MVNSDGCTAIYAACSKEHVSIVRLLLAKGADFYIADKTGKLPYNVTENQEIVDLLRCNERLHDAAKCGDLNKFAELLANKQQLNLNFQHNIEGTSLLFVAAAGNHVEIVKLLVSAGADVTIPNKDSKGETPLYIAAYYGFTEVCRVILVEIKSKSNSSLSKGVTDNKSTSRSAIDARTLNSGWTALFAACHQGHCDVARLLLSHDASISVVNNNGSSPLLAVSSIGNLEILNLLVAHCQSHCIDRSEFLSVINQANKKGETPLYGAAVGKHTAIAQTLINAGANVNLTESVFGFSALSVAASNGQTEMVRALLAGGANINHQDKEGWTPVNTAAVKGILEMTCVLWYWLTVFVAQQLLN